MATTAPGQRIRIRLRSYDHALAVTIAGIARQPRGDIGSAAPNEKSLKFAAANGQLLAPDRDDAGKIRATGARQRHQPQSGRV
jgi:hypothetical protein